MTDSNSNSYLIETHDLTRIYGDGEKIRALDGVNIKIKRGEFISVMGPSGSGKSTLLNMIGALDIPTSGSILIDGKNLVDIRDKDTFRSQTVGFMFQLHNLIPTLTARENVEVPMMGMARSGARRKRAEELLALVELDDRMKHLPSQLSGGQRQRVAVARALANKPPLILADEPTGSLDTDAGRDLMRLLHDLNESQGTTFIIVTHDPAVARQTHRIIVLADGKVARESIIGSPIEEDLKIWRYSGLGRRIVDGDHDGALKDLTISENEIIRMRDFLKQAG
ncbi:MAG: ABC transporter ATP-binding protein [Chloroflexi bacterium]|nr:ABC transporter ATP-binding protein [Chloroflexota bacterium]